MAYLMGDGFDHYGSAANMLSVYSQMTGNLTTAGSAGGGRTGSYCIELQGGQVIDKQLPVLCSKIFVGMALYHVNMGTDFNAAHVHFYDASNNEICSARFGTSGQIRVQNGGGGAITTSAINAYVLAQWQFTEFGYDNATNVLTVRVNGTVVVSGVVGNGAQIARVLIQSGTPSPHTMDVDDLYLCDGTGTINNGFLGDRRQRLLLPASDTAVADWSKSTGVVGWSLIDEVPPNGDTDYIFSSVVGNKSDFGFQALPGTVNAVAALSAFVYQKKTDAGATTDRLNLISNGTVVGAAITPATNYAYGVQSFDVDGAGNPFTPAGVNALNIEVERVS